MKDFLALIVAPLFVEIVISLFNYWLDNWHNNKKH
nr:type I toxin-antitoxin system Fst family toxin [Lactobacillus rodentium]